VISFTEAQLMAWLTPVLWPFLRVLALFTTMPIIGQRAAPTRVRVALAFLIALAASGVAPPIAPVPLDSSLAVLLVVQQVLIGLSMGFAVRLVFAAVELAGEIIGLQMGLNFAGFFDPATASQTNATSSLFNIVVGFLFMAINGHLLVIEAVAQSLVSFPVGPEPFAFLKAVQPQTWGADIFRMGFWIALPMIGMLLFTNLVMGVASRIAPQMNLMAIGFPITLSIGLMGLGFTLPMLQMPFVAALERMLDLFR
jgi:flagellar biosynthetic protein FliR